MPRAWTDRELEDVKIKAMKAVTAARDGGHPYVLVCMERGQARALAAEDLDPFGGLPELEDIADA